MIGLATNGAALKTTASFQHSHSRVGDLNPFLYKGIDSKFLLVSKCKKSGTAHNMAAQQKQDLRILIQKYNIHFDGPIDRIQWPATHFQTFENIQKLGHTEFASYRESITIESDDKPWRQQIKLRAERIVNLAKLCRAGRKNEAGWRMSLESEILARFTIEVACRMCRARLWLSELEVTANFMGRLSESLEERQKKRTSCTCRRGRRETDV